MENRTGLARLMRARITISPLFVIAGAVLLLMPSAVGSQVPALNTFSNGTVADADEVNQNFDSLRTAVNDNDTRITTLEGASAPAAEQIISSQGIQPGGGGTVFGVYGQSGSAPFASILIPKSGTLESMSASAFSALAAGAQMTVTLVINNVDSAASVVITPGNGTAMQTSGASPIAVSAGDLITFKFNENGGTNTAPGAPVSAAITLK